MIFERGKMTNVINLWDGSLKNVNIHLSAYFLQFHCARFINIKFTNLLLDHDFPN